MFLFNKQPLYTLCSCMAFEFMACSVIAKMSHICMSHAVTAARHAIFLCLVPLKYFQCIRYHRDEWKGYIAREEMNFLTTTDSGLQRNQNINTRTGLCVSVKLTVRLIGNQDSDPQDIQQNEQNRKQIYSNIGKQNL